MSNTLKEMIKIKQSENSKKRNVNVTDVLKAKEYIPIEELNFDISALEKQLYPTDLQKFKNFFDEMDIKYEVQECKNGTKKLSIDEKHIYYSYCNTIDVYFEAENEKFIQFEAYGE